MKLIRCLCTYSGALGALMLAAWPATLSGQTLFVPGGSVGTSSNSNIGIGTSSPDQRLTIKGGGIGFDHNSADKKLYSPADGVLEWMTHDAAGERAFAVSHQGQKRVYLSTSGNSYLIGGNVGIGTTTPQVKLHVYGAEGSPGFAIDGPSSSNPYLDFRQAGVEKAFLQYANAYSALQYHAPKHSFTGGNVGIGVTNPVARLQIDGQLVGGIGAQATNGDIDWNAISNARSGSGYTLLLGSAPNGPGGGVYFHPFNFEYGSKSGTGSITQLAIPYGNASAINYGIYMRGRYWSDPWGPWVRIISENTAGNVGIGTTSPSHKLSVNGTIRAKEVIVEASPWPDDVFDAGYKLKALSEVAAHIEEHGHLPDVPSAAAVAEQGVTLGEMQATLLRKIEELTLYIIAQEKRATAQDEEIRSLRAELAVLRKSQP